DGPSSFFARISSLLLDHGLSVGHALLDDGVVGAVSIGPLEVLQRELWLVHFHVQERFLNERVRGFGEVSLLAVFGGAVGKLLGPGRLRLVETIKRLRI